MIGRRPLTDAELEETVDLHNKGLTNAQIAKVLDRHASTISRRLQEARKRGLLPEETDQ